MVVSILWEAGFMFEEILLLCSLLLAIYGLANLISFAALWLTSPIKGKNYHLIMVVEQDDNLKATVRSARERLFSCGMGRNTHLIVVDGGLGKEKQTAVKAFCREQKIAFCPMTEISNVLGFFSSQNKENTL
jgi:hypothetical protein